MKMVDAMFLLFRGLRLMRGFEDRMTAARARRFARSFTPEVLCHYTGMSALRSILGQQAFRATDHNDVDDKGELGAAEEQIDSILAKKAYGPRLRN